MWVKERETERERERDWERERETATKRRQTFSVNLCFNWRDSFRRKSNISSMSLNPVEDKLVRQPCGSYSEKEKNMKAGLFGVKDRGWTPLVFLTHTHWTRRASNSIKYELPQKLALPSCCFSFFYWTIPLWIHCRIHVQLPSHFPFCLAPIFSCGCLLYVLDICLCLVCASEQRGFPPIPQDKDTYPPLEPDRTISNNSLCR